MNSDRNLVFGILALQVDFITPDALTGAMHSWIRAKNKSLGEILVTRGALDLEDRSLLDIMVDRHIEIHQGSTKQSLAALAANRATAELLEQIDDPDVQTLGALTAADQDPGADTRSYIPKAPAGRSVGTASSDGKRFSILRPHAHGGLGQVSVALDQELNREVALKEIQSKHADRPASRRRFVIEAEVTGGLEHPGIVPVYGLGHDRDGRPFYAMRFVRGNNLKDAIDRFHGAALDVNPGEQSVQFRNLLRRFIDVCNAIEYAHSRGVLHRDLKPSNIMLGKYGETLVVDWGLAKPTGRGEQGDLSAEPLLPASAAGDETMPGSAIGTPQFMSPEQAAGKGDALGSRSDVYSLGATLYVLLTGHAPFGGRSHMEVIQGAQRGDFDKPSKVKATVPRALEAVCLKAMALRAEDRYPSPRALSNDLEHWLADEPVSAYRDPPVARVARWARRHKTPVTAAAVLLITAVFGLSIGNLLLSEAKGRETAARQLAQDRFELALNAIEKYYTGASEDVMLKEEGLKQLRNKLLATALDFYRELESKLQNSSDQSSRVALARAYTSIGFITRLVGDQTQAAVAYKQALIIGKHLAADNPSAVNELALAKSYTAMGLLQNATGDPEAARESYRQAIEIGQRLVTAKPEVAEPRNELAKGYTMMGLLQSTTGDLKSAQQSLAQALKIRKKLVEDTPAANYANELAKAYTIMGILQRDTGDAPAALKSQHRAIEIGRKLVAEHPAVTDYQDQLATEYINLGKLQIGMGDAQNGLNCYRDALSIREALASDNPTVTQFRRALATAHNNLAVFYATNGDRQEAMKSLQQSLQIGEQLVAENPSVSEYRMDLSGRYNNLGSLQRLTGDTASAVKTYKRALEIGKELVADHPSVIVYQDDLAGTYGNLASVQWRSGNADTARESFRQALEIGERLVADHPSVTEYRSNLSTRYNNYGNLLRATGDTVAALESYGKGIDILRTLLKESEDDATASQRLQQLLYGRAYLLDETGQFARAISDWSELIELVPPRNSGLFRLERARSVALAGKHRRAVAEAGKLASTAGITGQALYKAARVFSLAVAAVEQDREVAANQREELAQQYVRRAVELLEQTRGRGFFEQPANLTRLREDQDWDPIRKNPLFQQFFAQP